jgi:hypothetical protein
MYFHDRRPVLPVKIIGPYLMEFIFHDTVMSDNDLTDLGVNDVGDRMQRNPRGIFLFHQDDGTQKYMGRSIDVFLKLNIAHWEQVRETGPSPNFLKEWEARLLMVDGQAFCRESYWLDIKQLLIMDLEMEGGS